MASVSPPEWHQDTVSKQEVMAITGLLRFIFHFSRLTALCHPTLSDQNCCFIYFVPFSCYFRQEDETSVRYSISAGAEA